jgi:predicted RNase H-like HicB family nuclease
MKTCLVVYERAGHNWATYASDVPGCIATGKPREDAGRDFAEALAFHREGLRLEGLLIPRPPASAGHVAVPA